MHHLIARAVAGTRLWRDSTEANALWAILARTFPELVALCLMPDHIHLLLPHADQARRFSRALAAYARWRNHHRRQRGPVWADHPAPQHLPDEKHEHRTHRYVHLNPCRNGLVADPLAWPWSTHRDAVELAVSPVAARQAFPSRFHRYVSGDPTVDVDGTDLPTTRLVGAATWDEVHDAVCALARLEPEALLKRGHARRVIVKTAWMHGIRDVRYLARAVDLTERGVRALVEHLPARGSEPGRSGACRLRTRRR